MFSNERRSNSDPCAKNMLSTSLQSQKGRNCPRYLARVQTFKLTMEASGCSYSSVSTLKVWYIWYGNAGGDYLKGLATISSGTRPSEVRTKSDGK